MKHYVKQIMMMAVLAVVGLSTVAFAGCGMGYYGQGGCGWNNMGGHGNGRGYGSNLSADEIKRLDAEQSEFFKATEGLKKTLYEKDLALRSELIKDNPDTAKVSNLQADISRLQGELDQKSLDYEMRARKAVPNYYSGYNGHGGGHGYGGGNCW
jgi:zinc resistance-associated protein